MHWWSKYKNGGFIIRCRKTVSSINSAGIAGQPVHVRIETRILFNTIYINKYKMDWRPKRQAKCYKTLRLQHRTFRDVNHSNIFLNLSPRMMDIKTKHKQTNKWDLFFFFYLKSKAFTRLRKSQTKWKDNLQNETKYSHNVTNKNLVSKIYKELM